MRVMIDVVHPAHVHFYRNLRSELVARGDEVLVVSRDKDVTLALLDHFGIEHVPVGRASHGSIVGHGLELARRDLALVRLGRRFRPDIVLTRNPAGVQAARVLGVRRELPSDPLDRRRRHRGDLLLPGRRVGARDVAVALGPDAREPRPADPVLREQQVVDRRDGPLATVGEPELAHRHVAIQDLVEARLGPVLVFDAAEVREADRFDAVVRVLQAEQQPRIGSLAVPLLDVPLALLAPAEAHGTVRHRDAAAALVIGQRLPLRVVGLAEAAQVARTQEALRHQAPVGTPLQAHQ